MDEIGGNGGDKAEDMLDTHCLSWLADLFPSFQRSLEEHHDSKTNIDKIPKKL